MWMMRAVLLAAVLFDAPADACGQSHQNPSPMVEHTRAHHRIEPLEHPGTKRSIDAGLPRSVTMFIPEGVTPGDRSLLIHFMGSDHVPLDAVAKTRLHDVLAVVNLGSGSSVFERPFREAVTFPSLIEAVANAAGEELGGAIRFERIDVSAFSAGYGAVRAILSQHPDSIHGLLLLDALHTGYVPNGTAMSEGGRLDTTLLDPFVRFAERAVACEKTFLFTHSEVFPGTFASTTETSDYLLDVLGLGRQPVLKWGPVGMQQLSESAAGGFLVVGFAGNSAPDHVDHLHGMSDFLRLLHRDEEEGTGSAGERPVRQRDQ